MLYELYPPQPELLTCLTSSLELHLKCNQRVVSGALKEHQATSPLNALGVGGDHVVPLGGDEPSGRVAVPTGPRVAKRSTLSPS